MKCEELKAETIVPQGCTLTLQMYAKGEVDAAIAELKEFAKEACLERDDNQNVINELEAENRRLKRALWMSRAERAIAEQTIDEWSRYKEKHLCGSWRADPFEYWVQAWIYVEKLCRKKAEEYK